MDALEREVQAQAVWIRRCDDPAALLDRMADFREDLRAGARDGNTRLQMRASELLELAEERVVTVKAARLRAPSTPSARADALRPEVAREGAASVRLDPHAAQRAREEQAARAKEAAAAEAKRAARALAQEREEAERRQRARQAEEEEQRAAARLANARAAEVEARVALLQAKAARLAKAEVAATSTPATPSVPGRTAGPSRRVAPAAPPASRPPEPAEDPMEAADRSALMQVARWPPPPARHGDPLWRPDAHWPSHWTLTGYDVAIFRGFLKVSQRVLAGQIGVPTVEITRAEARPHDKVRPALQVAVREAMDEAKRARERGTARAEVAPVVRAGEAGTARVDAAASAPSGVANGGVLTGADLARWRAATGLTQRQAAVTLGVAHGTVAKAELASGKHLGKQMEEALRKQR